MKQFHRFFFLVWHLWYHIRYDTLFDGLTVPAKFNITRMKTNILQGDVLDIVHTSLVTTKSFLIYRVSILFSLLRNKALKILLLECFFVLLQKKNYE